MRLMLLHFGSVIATASVARADLAAGYTVANVYSLSRRPRQERIVGCVLTLW